MKTGTQRIISICLSDIKGKAQERITKGKNGKLYISLSIYDRDEDQYGNDVAVTATPSKAEREEFKDKTENPPTIYVGNGRIYENKQGEGDPASSKDLNDLPF